MKLILLVTVVFIFAAGLVSGQSVKRNEALEQEIRRLDLAHADAILRRDVETLKKLMAEEVTTNHPTNKVVNEREGIFELIRTGVINYSSFERVQETFLFFKNMVIVMGRETLTPTGNAPGAGQTIRRRYTNIWMKNKGQMASDRATRSHRLSKLNSQQASNYGRHNKTIDAKRKQLLS